MTPQSVSPEFDSHNFIGFAFLEAQAFQFAPDLVTKSGRRTPYFFNSGQFRTGKTLSYLGKAYAQKLYQLWHHHGLLEGTVLFGPAYKGIGLAHVTAIALADLYGINVAVTYNRKEAKTHGEGGALVGEPLDGKNVIIIEDVITDGATKEEAIEIVHKAGGQVLGCIIAFDREERGHASLNSATYEFKEKTGVPVHAVSTLSDLIAVMDMPGSPPAWMETVQQIKDYRDEYGAH